MRRQFLAHFSIIALAGGLLAACGKEEPPPAASAAPAAAEETVVVRLGFAAPLTGPQAHYGKEMQNGIVLALDEINAEKIRIGGRTAKFELLAEDDQADPKQGAAVAQKLADAKIQGMLGHFNSGTTIPASRIYAEAGIPQIAMATSPQYTAQGFATTFRAMTSDTQQGAVLGAFAVNALQAKAIAIVDDRTAYGQGLADEFEKAVTAAGGRVVKREFTNDKAVDFRAILTSIKKTGADLVFFGGADAQAGPMVAQMRELGLQAQFAGGEMLKSPKFLELAGAAAEGAVASLAGLPLDRMPGGPGYAEKYKAKFGADVAVYSPYAYDAARVMVSAMQRADSADPAKYLPELAKTKQPGITSANIEYDEKGDLKAGGITVYKVQDGAWTVLETAGM
ncbi:MAG: branched-chain amino acid ABC transporter substrate-binding protein [Rhodocyclaceae bacterium]|nr:branched-chain amino acid ABC transporter substrate-binding protein [Rhodocyclaceae bacterium]